MNARKVQRKMLRMHRRSQAFTLVEMLIVVGAVGLIAVGLGKLFSSTGETVKIGKRLSYMNELATTLENRIRKDLAAATRDGPLVIRHKLITTGNLANPGILLSADDRNPAPRMRRADEITFLSQGRFVSNREPIWPGRSAISPVARIYFGHGMVVGQSSTTQTPELTDYPGAITWPAGLGEAGPNQYASDWILLRHVTLLARPQQTQSQLPVGPNVPGGLFTNLNWKDSPSQIQLTPAAPSVFRFDPSHTGEPDRLGYGYESDTGAAQSLTTPNLSEWVRANDSSVGWPQFMSGLVDVASVDPAMIRTRILSAGRLPFDVQFNPGRSPRMVTMPGTVGALGTANNPAHLSKMLMAGMLPSADPWIENNGSVATPDTPAGGNKREQRMLCSAKPVDFTGNLTNGGTPWPANQPYRQQDQAMLSASNLAVGCSEFSIEWSFGDVYPAVDGTGRTPSDTQNIGKLIWHGRAPEGANNNDFVTSPYRGVGAHQTGARYDAYTQQWVRKNGALSLPRLLPGGLMHWPVNITNPLYDAPLPPEVPLYSFFGYVDPTYTPPTSGSGQVDPDTIEWPWPKLLRFTISLTDPNDPNFEQTYQFIVELSTANQRQ